MCSFFQPFALFLASLLFVLHSHAMLFTGQTLISPDNSRYVALLGHHHEEIGMDHEVGQLDALVAACKEGVKEGKKFHILYERSGDLVKLLNSQKSVLADIEETFSEAQAPGCIIENIEIRDASLAANVIFTNEGRLLNSKLCWNNTSKPFDELTFQDVFDEFDRYANGLEEFIQKIIHEHRDCPDVCLISFKHANAYEHINHIKQFLQENNIGVSSKILILAKERIDDCEAFARKIRFAFVDLFDLHIMRRLLQLAPDVQPVIIAGAAHTHQIQQLLEALLWKLRLSKGEMFAEIPKPLDDLSIHSFVLNESEWDRTKKAAFNHWVSIKIAARAQFKTLRDTILSEYCK